MDVARLECNSHLEPETIDVKDISNSTIETQDFT